MRLKLEFPPETTKSRHSQRTGSAAGDGSRDVTSRLARPIVALVPTRFVKPDGNPRYRTWAEAVDPRLRTVRSNPGDGNNFFCLSRDGDGPRAPPDVTPPPIRRTHRGPGARRSRRRNPRHPPHRSLGPWSAEPRPEERGPAADPIPYSKSSQTSRGPGVVAGVGDGPAPPAEPSPGDCADKEMRPTSETRHGPPFYIGHCNNESKDESGKKTPHTLSTPISAEPIRLTIFSI
jgi:hypothetical protein